MVLTCEGQEIPASNEQQLENLTGTEEVETEDDSYLQQLEQFRKNPLDLNTADATELKELRIINELQVENLIAYRKLLGKLIDIYELQAVPYWDITTIRKVLPFVTIGSAISIKEDLMQRIKNGEHSFLIRMSQVLERSKGFTGSSTGIKYLGNPQRLFFRYRYAYKNLLQFGLTGDKDAGEQFFKGAQSKGFDFYSFHLFIRKTGCVQSLAIGDFTVSMGQGLIQWQSLAFGKNGEITSVKRQSAVLKPYNSAGEFNFHRGIGITIKKGMMEATVFASIRRLNANLVTDTLTGKDIVSSFLNSGYNRSAAEIADRNVLFQTSTGSCIQFNTTRFKIGINGVYYQFSLPIRKNDEPYNLYALNGDKFYNLSVDYGFTYRNLHFFGEAATDRNFNRAFINGLLLSVDPRVDISILHRDISKAFHAVNGNAFTENSSPANETGIYAGISIRPASPWRVDAYVDIYRFAWLKYLVDAPGFGKDMFVQLTYSPGRQVEIFTRYRQEIKQGNEPGPVTNYLIPLKKQNWRLQLNYKISPATSIRNRIEIIWYGEKANNPENGFLAFFDLLYKPMHKPYSAVVRLQYFETEGYNSRLYAFENDVLYSYSIPVFFDKGFRYYFTGNYDMTKKISIWLRWAQTIYSRSGIGSGYDEIQGNKRSEIRFQAQFLF